MTNRPPWTKHYASLRMLRRDLGMLVLIALFACCVGQLVRVYQHPVSSGMKATDSGNDLSLGAFRSFVTAKKGLVLDARSSQAYSAGHVGGALAFPAEYFEGAYLKYKTRLEADKNQAIAVYCSDADCHSSRMTQRMLIALGYRHVMVFPGGWSEWQKAGLPEEHTE